VPETTNFRFADIEVRPAEWLLLKAGDPVPIEPKAFRVLVYLLRNPGRLVTKNELLDAVWEATSVSENSLTRSIASLRRQLGDDAREPKFIATVHTEGYRFVCPIAVSNGALDGSLTHDPDDRGRSVINIQKDSTGSQIEAELRQGPSPDAILAQLERILASPPVANSNRSQRFLRYIVESSLKSEEEPLKEYAIALEVFERDPAYDPSIDATVRVEAGRLRSRLRDYYRGSDPSDRVLIDIPKGAYRATFTSLPVHDVASVGQKNQDSRPRPPWLGAGVLAIAAIVLTAVIVAGAWFAYRTVKNHHEAARLKNSPPVRVVQLTNLPGEVDWPAFSPDGKEIAFIWDPLDHPSRGDLYVQLVGGNAPPLRLTHTLGAYMNAPAWSPDGHEIAFGRCDDHGGAIYTIPALGGPEHRITDIYCRYGFVPPVSWSADGKLLVLADACVANGPRSLVVFSMDTGTKRCLVDVGKDEDLGDSGGVLSPDQHTVAFVRVLSNGAADLYSVPLEGGTPTRLTADNREVDGLMWTADGKYICFDSTRSGTERVWRVPGGGGTIEPETTYPAVGALSPDGSRLIYPGPSVFSGSSVWRAKFSSEGGTIMGKQQLLPDSAHDYAPRPSPDAKQSVFESVRSGSDQIWKSNADGSDPRQLTSLNGSAGSPQWSADGKWIVFDFLPEDHRLIRQVFMMDAEGRNLHRVVFGNDNNGPESWSHDGKAIYFASDRTGSFQIWRKELATGRETQLTHDGGLMSLESADGKTLYFSKLSGGGIWAIPVTGGTPHLVTDALHFGYWGEFAVTENGIYLVDSDTDPGPALMYYCFRTGQLKRVLNLNGPPQKAIPWSANLGVSRDGRTVLVVLATFRNSLVMAENLH
jgi:Tol biopolymer transport system component/DNA-binding winged helix-turn-helix (wHTH) protein